MRHSGRVPSHDHHNDTLLDRVDPMLGEVLDGKYRLDIRIASGGFGAVYQASHVETGVELAVKVVHARLASDPDIVARFQREGAALTALRSPHTITAYELGETPDGVLYIAMELLRGVSLYHRLRDDGPLPWRRMVSIAIGVCHSLAEAHALGIVHRDLKPTNIHLERRGPDGDFVKVLDFGIAKILQHSPFESTDLTSAGLMIGTIDYMSPEQMVGGEITGASDLYTLGIVIYEMIAGKRPFPAAPTAASVLAAMLKPPPPLASVADVPAELDRIVMRCLARDAEHRHQTADELAGDLRRLLERRSPVFDSDDDATQIAPARPVAATLMSAAAPPPPDLAATFPSNPSMATIPSNPSLTIPTHRALTPRAIPATPRATTEPLTVTPRRATPASPPPVLPPAEPARRTKAPSSPVASLLPPPPELATLPLAPVDTLRGVAFPQPHDSGRVTFDPTVMDAPSDRRKYDAARVAQRDAMVRRLIWVCIVVATLIAMVLAARL
jgi:serine/threonine-protein kinase